MLLRGLIVLLGAVYCYAQSGPKEYALQCQKDYNIPDDVFKKIQWNLKATDEQNVNQRCFIECMLKAEGTIKNGELDQDFVVEEAKKDLVQVNLTLDEPKFRRSVATCAAQDGQGQCTRSNNIWKCLADLLSGGLPLVS
ncbi:hypothetical protein C0J52_24060 [Blattella germanica]|uniref:Chemosensory protein n=1 Tax=Blattella germanica TaxID=6973 RepID=A0A0X8DF69_BLAGE|nr:chemosensory protein [Blattella germanica]PSN36145.1 hypothetical protein C0J52_24060 [Blattella germanica]